jgi:putative sigma-54 modulation protein
MQTQFVFRHMDSSDALRNYAEERLTKIKRYFSDPLKVNCTFSVEKINHIAQFDVTLRNGLQLHSSETTENMYSSIDLCIAKIERQVRKYKGKLEGMRARPHHVVALPWSHSIIDEAFHELNELNGNGTVNGKAVTKSDGPGRHPEFTVVKTEKFHAQPMSVADAIVQLNLLHEPFLVFRHDTDGRVAVVYKREDGSYGLIETPTGTS